MKKKTKLASKRPNESMVETNYLVLPSHANALDTIFGGVLMSWIDIVAAISGQRHSNHVCVTASVDTLHFLSPVRVGDAVTLCGQVVHTGRTSMTIRVDVTASSPAFPKPRRCVKAYLTFIALDENKRPTMVPPLKVSTAKQKLEFKEAARRRLSLLKSKTSW